MIYKSSQKLTSTTAKMETLNLDSKIQTNKQREKKVGQLYIYYTSNVQNLAILPLGASRTMYQHFQSVFRSNLEILLNSCLEYVSRATFRTRFAFTQAGSSATK